ncbi:hypothetical protein HOY82DRAFT_117055 [Tuber indicum]|nr:hypothetical protein HOY82DRAFT_117055 [Tuber indicum]
MSVTKLIEYVLEEVSIDGSEGTTIKQLFAYVTEFYTKTLVPKVEINSLCEPPQNPWGPSASGGGGGEGEADPGSSTTPQGQPVYWGVPNMRDEFQDYVWDILRQQGDFKVGVNGEGNELSLNEIVADLRNQAEGGKEEANGEGKIWRVYTSDERHWRTLTGHGPDLKRRTRPHPTGID